MSSAGTPGPPSAAPAPGAQLAHAVEVAFELAAARARQVVPAAADGVEAAAHLVEGVGELAPLLLERRQADQDLVGRALEPGLLDRLADDGEHREQRARRAQDDLLPQRHLDQVTVVLVHEGVDGLVGDEEQDLVERVVGVDVHPTRQLAHPGPHVAHEGDGVLVALAVGVGLEVAQVVVDRELHVHVQHPPARQQEREVGDGARGESPTACGS